MHCFSTTLQLFAFFLFERNCIFEGLCPHNHHIKWHFNLPSPPPPEKSWQYWLISSSVFFSLFIFMTTCCLPSFSQFSPSVVSDSLRPHGMQHARLPCPSPTPRAYSNACPSSRWCHPIISSSVIPFSSHLQSFPASGSFPMSVLHVRWPKYWSFSFSISHSKSSPTPQLKRINSLVLSWSWDFCPFTVILRITFTPYLNGILFFSWISHFSVYRFISLFWWNIILWLPEK